MLLVDFLSDSLGGEVADEQLQKVEADEVGGDVETHALYGLGVDQDDGKGAGPSGFAVQHHFVNESVVAPPHPPHSSRNQHLKLYRTVPFLKGENLGRFIRSAIEIIVFVRFICLGGCCRPFNRGAFI